MTNAPVATVSSYLPDAPRLTASLPVSAIPAGSSIDATWEYNETSLDAFTTRLVPGERIEATWIAVHIDREPDTPWPVGVYEVTIALDGIAMQQAAVEVTGPG